jgi:hypothetical protein
MGTRAPSAGHAGAHHGRDKIDWPPEVWHRIDAAVREEIRRSRVVSKFLPTVHIPAKATTVPSDEVIAPGSPEAIALGEGAGSLPQGALFVDETETTRINEIWVEFSMTPAQVEEEAATVHGHHEQQHLPHQPHSAHQEPHGQHAHPHEHHHGHHHHIHASTGVSLATRAANILAQVEDSILCQGENAFLSALIGNQGTTTVGYRFITTDLGLLNLPTAFPAAGFPTTQSPQLPPDQIVFVSPATTGFYQERTVAAIAKAFSILQSKGQYGPYALVLQTQPFADANSPLATTLITPAEPMRHLMNAGFFGTGTLPPFVPALPGGSGGLSGPLFGTGGVLVVAITNGGSGYNAVPSVTIAGAGGSTAGAAATISGGAVIGVTITSPGSGYTSPPSVTIAAPTGANPVTATAVVPSTLYTGFVVSLGGNTMDLVRGRMTADEDVIVRFEQKDANGYYRFRVIERFALRLKDITAVVQLQFLSA